MYGANDVDYVGQSANLYRTAEQLVRDFKQLELKVTQATQDILNGNGRYVNSDRMLTGLLDAQQNLDGIRELVNALNIQPKVEAKVPDNITIDMIRETFYNTLPLAIGLAISEGLITDKNDYFEDEDGKGQLYTSAAALVLISVMQDSKDIPKGILLINRKILTKENCPADEDNSYKKMLEVLLACKDTINNMPPDLLKKVRGYLINVEQKRSGIDERTNKLIGTLFTVGVQVSQLPNFKKVANGALWATKTMV